MIDTHYFTPLQRLASWEQTSTGIRAEVDSAVLTVDVLKAGLLRIQIALPGRECEANTYAVCADLDNYAASFEVQESPEALVLVTKEVRVTVSKLPFRLEVHRADGSPILESPLNGTLGSYARLNDEFVVTRRRNDADVVLGLGQKTGRMNRNGRHFTLWNTDVLDPSSVKEHTAHLDPDDPRTDCRGVDYDPYYISIPFYQGLDSRGRAAGFFVDNVHRGHFEFDHEGETRIHFVGGQYVEYVFAGPSLQSILSDYTELTGRMSAPPMWALGYHHCRWHPYDQADVLEIAATYRKKGIPCDSIWLDIDHMDGYRVFTWNKAKFPDPPAMLSALKGNGFRTVTIVDPGVKVDPDYSVFQSGLAAKAFCLTEGGGVYEGQVWPGKTAFPDFANERARAWWGALNAQHVQSGLAGIWNDMNEPATGAIPAYPMRFDGGKYSHGTYHNAYALLMAMGTTEGLRKAMPDLRTFVLSRAGSAGIQRYAANWLGDNMSRWDHLWLSLPMSLGLGLSGQPFVGADIGGFGEDCEAELLVRWFQAAALSPFCRHHNDAGGRDQYPWSFDARVEKICHAALDLRYRLMPYLYSAFVESSQSGVPVMRPLVMSDQTDARLPEVDDQYLLGPHLIVAPVVEKGATSREVVLPAGEWIGWWTEVPAKSGAVAAPLDQIPVFARAGAVIPVWPEAPASTLAYRPETIDLHVFVPSQDGTTESMLVEDDGETLGYEQGQRLVTTFRLTRAGDSLSLEATTTGAPFEGWRRTAFRVILRTPGSVPKVVEAGLEGFRWAASL